MIESDKRIYPAEEREPMLEFFDLKEGLAVMEEDWDAEPDENDNQPMVSSGPRSRFGASIWNTRSWTHWPMGFGGEEGAIGESIEALKAFLGDEAIAMPRLEGCDAPGSTGLIGTGPLAPASANTRFIAFNEATAAKCTAALGVEVITHGVGDEAEEVMKPIFEDKAPVILVVEPKDLEVPAEAGIPYAVGCNFVALMTSLRERNPDTILTVVLLASDYEAHATNKWLMPAMNQLVENCDVCLFATDPELPSVKEFFCGAKFEGEQPAKVLAMGCNAFPRLHFFTFSTAMGQELEKRDILFPSYTVGSAAPGMPTSAFAVKPWPDGPTPPPPGSPRPSDLNEPDIAAGLSTFFVGDGSFVPMTERVIPGKDGGAGATVIAPARTLCKLFNRIGTCNHGQRWPDDTVVRSVQDLFKHDGYVGDDNDSNKPFLNMDELEEQYANLQDLMSELGQYHTINGGSEVELPDPPEGWEDEE